MEDLTLVQSQYDECLIIKDEYLIIKKDLSKKICEVYKENQSYKDIIDKYGEIPKGERVGLFANKDEYENIIYPKCAATLMDYYNNEEKLLKIEKKIEILEKKLNL